MAYDMRAAVRKGAQLLDTKHPGWQYLVDESKIDMASLDTCPAGQLDLGPPSAAYRRMAPFHRTMAALDLYTHTPYGGRSAEYGFTLMEGDFFERYGSAYDELKQYWIEEIRSRRLP